MNKTIKINNIRICIREQWNRHNVDLFIFKDVGGKCYGLKSFEMKFDETKDLGEACFLDSVPTALRINKDLAKDFLTGLANDLNDMLGRTYNNVDQLKSEIIYLREQLKETIKINTSRPNVIIAEGIHRSSNHD